MVLDPIIATMRFNPPEFASSVTKYMDLYNHLFQAHANANLYYESMQDGIIAIYKDKNALKWYLAPRDTPLQLNPSPAIAIVLDFQPNFPTNGLEIDIFVKNLDPKELYATNVDYFKLIHSEISVQPTVGGLRIFFPYFNAFANFFYDTFSRFPEH
jgi:hypothetical protein